MLLVLAQKKEDRLLQLIQRFGGLDLEIDPSEAGTNTCAVQVQAKRTVPLVCGFVFLCCWGRAGQFRGETHKHKISWGGATTAQSSKITSYDMDLNSTAHESVHTRHG